MIMAVKVNKYNLNWYTVEKSTAAHKATIMDKIFAKNFSFHVK